MWFVGSEKPCIYSVPNRKQSYGERLAIYLFGKNIGRFAPVFYTIASVLGAFGSVDVLINFLDIMYAGMIIPNVIGLFILRKEIKEQTDDFFLHERFK